MKRRIVFFGGFVTLASLFLAGCMQRPMDQSFRRWDHMMGYGGWGMMFMWLVVVVVAALIIYVLLARRSGDDLPGSSRMGETPLEILKKRYARGEITKDEFDRMKDDIESS